MIETVVRLRAGKLALQNTAKIEGRSWAQHRAQYSELVALRQRDHELEACHETWDADQLRSAMPETGSEVFDPRRDVAIVDSTAQSFVDGALELFSEVEDQL